MTQQEIIAGCLQNNRKCQQALFAQYAGKMLLVCQRYARNSQQAEDMLQQGFIRVFTALHTYRGQGSFEGWIRRIVVNASLRLLQTEQSSWKLVSANNPPELPDESEDLAALLTGKEIMQLIQQLPDGYRTVLNLFVFEQYSHDEIASLLQISPGTSRSQLAKARRMLLTLMEEQAKISTYEPRRAG